MSLTTCIKAGLERWISDITTYHSSRKSQAKQKTSSQSQSSSTEPTNTTTEKKKKKKNEMTLEAALKELHIKASTTEKNGKRRVCHCQGIYTEREIGDGLFDTNIGHYNQRRSILC